MKKMHALVGALFVSFVVAAQTDPKFGIKGGLNLSTLNYANGTNTDWRSGFHLGFLSHVHITPAFSLQPEIYYSSQGTKQPYTDGNTLNLDLRYINLPVLAQYNFHNGLRLQGGPQVGFLVGVSDEVKGVEQNAYSTADFNTVDISL
ncbi:MAG TPA: porin family protein, partial [Flavisolibacter sp.]|nr:porin family protein [Flavisolibacter sp.]